MTAASGDALHVCPVGVGQQESGPSRAVKRPFTVLRCFAFKQGLPFEPYNVPVVSTPSGQTYHSHLELEA